MTSEQITDLLEEWLCTSSANRRKVLEAYEPIRLVDPSEETWLEFLRVQLEMDIYWKSNDRFQTPVTDSPEFDE